jgi:hypothetical protein
VLIYEVISVNDIQRTLKNLGGVILKNSPTILTGLGCAGVLTTAFFTGHATLKAYTLIKMEEDELDKELSPHEIVGLTWTCFVPPVIMGATSIACILGANSINTSRNAALAALYSLSETTFREYKEKVVEQIGRNKELKVRDDIARDRIEKNPVGDRTIIITGNGDVLCYDTLSDRYFRSSCEKIRQQVLDLGYRLRSEMWLDLNEFYDAIGLGSTKLGSQMGFDLDKTRNGNIEVEYSSHLTPNSEPCLSIEATVYPKYSR